MERRTGDGGWGDGGVELELERRGTGSWQLERDSMTMAGTLALKQKSNSAQRRFAFDCQWQPDHSDHSDENPRHQRRVHRGMMDEDRLIG